MDEKESCHSYLTNCGISPEPLSAEDQEKLTRLLQQKDAEIQEGKVEIEKLRISSDQHCFALEKELQDVVQKLNEEQSKLKTAETKQENYERNLNDVNSILTDLKNKSNEQKLELDEFKTRNNDLLAEKNNLIQVTDRLNNNIDNLNAEVKSLTQKLADSNKAKCEALLKCEEACGNDIVSQSKVRHLNQEKERLSKIIDNLNSEMAQATQAIYTARTEQAHKILNLQSRISQLEDQGQMDKEAKNTLQTLLEDREKKIESLMSQLKDQRDGNIQAESQFNHELRSQVKLTNLYKASVEESQNRVKELLAAAEEMQTLLKQAVDDNKLLTETNERYKKDTEDLLSEKSERINKLERELVNANELLKQCRKQVVDIDTLSPSAAAASNLLKSGKTLTQIYSEYIELSNQLQEEKGTNAKLNVYLEQILKEVEEKAPYLYQQKENLERSLESVNLLSQELQKLKMEKEYLESSHLEMNRKAKVLAVELENSERSKDDLGRQICQLLKQIEVLKGKQVIENSGEADRISDKSDTEIVISENLVAFKDIVELQMQNQKLLAVVRELSENRQEEENLVYEKRITELKSELEAALNQISELRDTRNKQNEVVTSIIRQRDMYKLMATSKDDENISGVGKTDTSAMISPQKSPITKIDDAYLHLQEEFNKYKTETTEQLSTLREQFEKVKEERVELRLHNGKLSSQLEFSNERYQNLSSTTDGYKKEIAALTTRNEKLSSLAAKHEEISVALRNELLSVQEKISRVEIELTSSRKEKTLLQQSEAHLQGEIEVLKLERSGQAALLSNLQEIQKNFEKHENDWNGLLKTRIESLEKEVANLQSKLDLEGERFRDAAQVWVKERQDLNTSIKEQVKKQNDTQEELIQAYSMVHELRIEKSALEAKLKNDNSLERVYTSVASDNSNKTNTEVNQNMNLQLQEARSTIISLRDQMKRQTDHLIQLKSMSSSLEEELAEQNRVNDKFKEETEQLLKSKASKISKLEDELEIMKKENENLLKEKSDLAMKSLVENTEMQANMQKAVNEFESLKEENINLRKSVEDLRMELQSRLEMLEEVRRNYENEMAAHTSDLTVIEKLQQEKEEAHKKLKDAEELKKNAEYLLEVTNSTSEDKEIKMNEEIKRLSTQHDELTSQNENLLELLDRLKAQMIVYRNRKEQQSDDDPALKEHSEEQMFDVIKYLRKEKDIALARYEVIQAENVRLSTKVEFLEKQLKETTKTLQEIQDKEQVSVTTATQHAELMRKVELLNVLTDGNRVLRAEKNDLLNQIKHLETKTTEMDKELTLIKASHQELVTQRDALEVESKSFKAESQRWQSRAQFLVEQTSKNKADDMKKLMQEKDSLTRQISTVKEELMHVKSSLATSETQITSLQKDLENTGSELTTKSRLLTKVSDDNAVKDSQINELNKSLQQVRKIARKYKLQFDELKVENDKLKVEAEQLSVGGPKASESEPVSQVAIAEAVETAKQVVRQEYENKIKEVEENFKSSEEKMKKIRQSAYKKISTLTSSKEEQQREFEECKAKFTQLEQAKTEESVRVSVMKTEYENSIASLKNDLMTTRGTLNNAIKEKTSLLKEIEELNAKLSIQQKQLESIQKQLKESLKMSSSTTLPRDSSILAQSSSDVVNPPTANIKPMATPSSSVVRHPHPSTGSSTRPTPMGRIRPITAVSPATSRTVAVPPTSASSSMAHSQQQDSPDDGHPTPSTGVSSTSSVPQATVAPTQAIVKHAVVASVQQLPVSHQSSSLSEDIVSATNTGMSVTGSFEDRGFEAEMGESSASADNEKKARDVESSSTDGLSSTTDSIKRPRDDSEIDSSSEALVERSPKKRSRIDESRADAFHLLSNSSETLNQHRGTIAQVQATTSQAMISPSTIGEAAAEDPEEIIVLESDDDSLGSDNKSRSNEIQNAAVDGEDEEPDDDDDVYENEQEENEEFQEGSGPETEDEPRYSDDNEIVILDDPESVTRSNDVEQPSEAGESVTMPSQNRRFVHRFPTRSERLPSIGRQHTVPCSFIGPHPGSENDDSIVPSTPTLFDSRRNDAYAEASSPQVPSETFQFGNSEQPSQLATQAFAMDDTRMDLTQFDDGTGRSVPSTPYQTSPLDATVSEMNTDMLPDTSNASSSHLQSYQVKASTANATEADQAIPIVPKITVTGLDENTFTIEDDIQEVGGNNTNILNEPTATTSNEETFSSSAVDLTVVEVISLDYEPSQVESDNELAADTPLTAFPSDSEGTSTSAALSNEGNSQLQELQSQRRTTPIIWDEPLQSRRGVSPTRASQPNRATPVRSFARRSRPLGGPAGLSRGNMFTYYRDNIEQQPNRLGHSRGPRMGMPQGRGNRTFSRQRR